ncbi:TRAP transporter substrate-binding protein DctP [Virgibacillus sp. NKC19-3]|uniref:TRAP transporter substrate-binding protein n=1 Tax=Virgibacillus saliphilus TaxID=2831674 RepID=UPI001C9B94B0|nr:TRAP transporter substrate-binding protein DctP [Virgibacillus sp. NKC19-3]MBY7144509.1 TRAP transporter substrate-binding protein DctP [Virgibacillus sp. NKC19-3]
MRKIFIGFVVFSLLLMGSCSNDAETNTTGEEQNEVISLKVADSVPSTNFISQEGIVYWMDRVEELTDGKVEFQYFPSEQLGKSTSLLELVNANTVDIAYTSYASEKLPLSEVATLPGAVPSSEEGSKIYWKLVEEFLLEEEYLKNGVRPMFAVTLPNYQILTTETKVTTIEDLKGLKLRTPSGPIEVGMNALGASPVAMAAPEMYTAIERGTIEGAVIAETSYKPYQLQKAANYSTTNANMGSFVANYSINEEVYQNLPEEIQQAMNQAGEDTMVHFSKFLDEHVEELIKEFEEEGMDMYELDDETLSTLNRDIQSTWDEWAQKLEERGYPGKKTLHLFNDIKQDVVN